MNDEGATVFFRTGREINKGRLQFEGNRVFLAIYEYGPKGSTEVIKQERMELDPAFLVKIDPAKGADYSYQKEVQLPDPGKN